MAARSQPRPIPRTPWHLLFAQLLIELGSSAFDIQTEVELLRRPTRADFVIIRRKKGPVHRGRILRRLWSWIDHAALIEFKSQRAPISRGEVLRWLSISLLFWSVQVAQRREAPVQAVLVVVTRTRALMAELKRAALRIHDEGGGYLAVTGSVITAKIIILDEVARAERTPLLGLFSGTTLNEPRVQRWFHEHAGKVIEAMGSKVTQTHSDFLEAFIASLPAKQRLAGLDPEQLVDMVLGLPSARRILIARLGSLPTTTPTRVTRKTAKRARKR